MQSTDPICPLVGAVAVFFIATLLFIGDEFYKNISVRLSTLFFVIILVFGGILNFIFAVMGFYYVLNGGDTAAGAGVMLCGLGACLALGTAVILLLRVRKAGWLKKKVGSESARADAVSH